MRRYGTRVLAAVMAGTMAAALAGCGSSSSGSTTAAASGSTTTTAASGSTTTSASSASSDGKIQLTFWHSMSETNGQAVQALVDDFNNSQDEIYVNAEYQGKYDDVKTKMSAALQSGKDQLPDIVQMYDIGTKYMVDSGLVIPVEDMFSTTGYDPDTIMSIVKSYYTVDGKQYSMPLNVSTPMLYYNKDAFEAAGLDPDTPPTTWEEVKEYAQKIQESGACRYGYAQAIYGWFFEQEIATLGEDYGDNDNGRSGNVTKVMWNENGTAKKIMDNWMDLINSGYAGNYGQTTGDTQTAFFAGQVGMIIESTAILKNAINNSDFEIGTGYLPRFSDAPDDGGVIIGGASLWLMDTGDTEREEAAWKFLEFTTSAEEQSKFSQGTGYFAINEDAYELDDMKSYLEQYPGFETAINQLKDSPVNTHTAGVLSGVAAENRKSFQNYMEEVINGTKTVDEAIAACEEECNAAITNYNTSTGS
ncbi:MAG: ABC transporter substrate-binding protein [Lachnospiraceae bacterium]